jgi:hypothetical protein
MPHTDAASPFHTIKKNIHDRHFEKIRGPQAQAHAKSRQSRLHFVRRYPPEFLLSTCACSPRK